MAHLPCFNSAQLESICKIIADTTYGLKGAEIAYILNEISVPDNYPSLTKWKRLFNAFVEIQK